MTLFVPYQGTMYIFTSIEDVADDAMSMVKAAMYAHCWRYILGALWGGGK